MGDRRGEWRGRSREEKVEKSRWGKEGGKGQTRVSVARRVRRQEDGHGS